MTAQIANTIDEVLQPLGVAVVIEGEHQCMTTRGIHKPGVGMVTSRMLGGVPRKSEHAARVPRDDREYRKRQRRLTGFQLRGLGVSGGTPRLRRPFCF